MKTFLFFSLACSLFLFQSCNLDSSTGPQTGNGTAPPAFYLNQNYPNPFSDTTTIEYGVPNTGGSNSFVSVIVYDSFRQEIRVLASGNKAPTNYTTHWYGENSRGIQVPPGTYTIELVGKSPQTVIIRILAIKK